MFLVFNHKSVYDLALKKHVYTNIGNETFKLTFCLIDFLKYLKKYFFLNLSTTHKNL